MSDSGSLTYDNLIAGTQKQLVTRNGTVRVYESFARGALLGLLTATNKWQVIDEDGAATCSEFGIATEAVDTTAGATAVTDIFVEGEFSETAVIYAYGDTADDWREILAPKGIYLRKTISTAGV
jgi:hypothetical protein